MGNRIKNKIIVFTIALIAILSCVTYIYVAKYMPNRTLISPYEYFSELDENLIYVIIEDRMIDKNSYPIERNGEIYVPFSFVKEYIDPYIFWDNNANRLTITKENEVIRMRADDSTYFINNIEHTISLPIYNLGEEAYMPINLLIDTYNVNITYSDNYNRLIITFPQESPVMAEAIEIAELRYEPDIKSPIQYNIEVGEILRIFDSLDSSLYDSSEDSLEDSLNEKSNFVKVRTQDGLLGFVLKDSIGQREQIAPAMPESSPLEPLFDRKLNIVWDQLTTFEANFNETRRVIHDGLDVLSPTWFSFDREALNGDIISIADIGYVEWAHAQGYQVWALITDNFDYVVSNAILSNTDIREYVIDQLIDFVISYNLDGINIDFEMVRRDDAPYYIQFIRELAPFLKELGAILSVDMYVPTESNMYYNRTEVGKVADYVIIMAYDEHWATSPVSGPVASIGFVENGIVDTLKEVPKEKIILGLPFYVRVWTETPDSEGNIKVTSRAYSMEYAYNMFIENGVEFVWNETTANYYAEYDNVIDGVTVKTRVWLEDERSIEEKLKLAVKYDIAGVAGWRRNLEKPAIWELIKSYMR